MGPGHHRPRASDLFLLSSSSDISSPLDESSGRPGQGPGTTRRSTESTGEVSSGDSSSPLSPGLFQHHLPSSKAGKSLAPSHRLELTKQVHRPPSLQNGNDSQTLEFSDPGRLGHQHRLNRCLPSCSYACVHKTVPTVRSRRSSLHLQGSPLRSQHSSVGVYQDHGCSDDSGKKAYFISNFQLFR